MNWTSKCAVVAIALCVASLGCGGSGGTDATGGNGGSGGSGNSGGTVQIPEIGDADRADVSYADNLLEKVEDGEWTLGEGLVATLQAFVGERDVAEVLRHQELLTYEGTGVFDMARDYLEDGPDPEAQSEVARLVRRLEFSVERDLHRSTG